jgi:hypothetical protein
MGRHKRENGRTEYSRGGGDDMTDHFSRVGCSDIPRKHRSHRRSHPVTSYEYDGINRAGLNPAHLGDAGIQQSPAAYAQFSNPAAPVYFSPGQENGQNVPVIPLNSGQREPHRGRDEVSAGEQSEVGSSSQEGMRGSVQRGPSIRRHHSKASSTTRGRLGRY